MLDSKSVIYLEGKSNETLTKLKQIITEQGFIYVSNLTEQVTHIIIGKNPKNPNVLNYNKYKYLEESVFHEMKSFNNPGFLEKKAVEGNDSSSSKVKLLLENPDPVSYTHLTLPTICSV